MTERYSEWTSCQMFGHNFGDEGRCEDCGEVSDQDICDLGRENRTSQ